MSQQSSRLQRLLILLDTGSTQATRFVAAQQIGDIAKTHPQDLGPLLDKVAQYFLSKNWDTRVAAAHAVGTIAGNVKHISLRELLQRVKEDMLKAGYSELDVAQNMDFLPLDHQPATAVAFSFSSLDITKVLEFGAPLLASVGQEYDVANDNSKNSAEKLARQKQMLRRRLGLDVCEQFMDVSEMIKDEDLVLQKFPVSENGAVRAYSSQSDHVQQLVGKMIPKTYRRRLSARQINLLKRKAKVNAKDQAKSLSDEHDLETSFSDSRTPRKGVIMDAVSANKENVEVMFEDDGEQYCNGKWPFTHFVEQLLHDMFDANWEVRHGSIMALREILSHQGGCAGVLFPDFTTEYSSIMTPGAKDGSQAYLSKHFSEDDANVFVGLEGEHMPKRIKVEDMSSAFQDVRMESDSLNTSNIINEETFEPVKFQSEKTLDAFFAEHKLDDDTMNLMILNNNSVSKGRSSVDFSENYYLLRLLKIARHSQNSNWEFLQDCAIRLLCILCLDRFGDYISDQVVAPVRETCAQALGAVLKYMHPSLVHQTLDILLHMQHRQEWEVRHGSLLGIKYLVAVRKEMLQELLPCVLPACRTGLEDPDDDVRAVAAEALIPAAEVLVFLNSRTLCSIVMLLWDILLDLDDLSPSTSSVMSLLAEIYSQPEMIPKILGAGMKQELDLNVVSVDEHSNDVSYEENPYMLATLAPRLWPFMRHSISSVRRAAIFTLEKLLEVGSRTTPFTSLAGGLWPASVLGDTLRIVFQNLLLESNEEIMQCTERVWRLLLKCPESDLEAAARPFFSCWLDLATTPYGSAVDATKMFFPMSLPRKSSFRAAAKMRAVKSTSTDKGGFDSTSDSHMFENNGDVTVFPKIIIGADIEKSVTHTRAATATALGILASKLSRSSLQFIIRPLFDEIVSLSGVKRQVASVVLISWFRELKQMGSEIPSGLHDAISQIREWLLNLLSCSDPAFPTKDSQLPYSELSRTYTKMRTEASHLYHILDSSGLSKDLLPFSSSPREFISVEDAIHLASKLPSSGEYSGRLSSSWKHIIDDVEAARQRLLSTAGYLKCVQSNLHTTVTALVAAAVVWLSELPGRLNPVILPLMAAVKREQEEILQQEAAEALAELISQCIIRKPGPNDKLIKNICSLACLDPSETPQAALTSSVNGFEEQDIFVGRAVLSGSRRTKFPVSCSVEERSKVEGYISRRGSELTLKYLCKKFGGSLFDKLPRLWDCLTEVLQPSSSGVVSDEDDHVIAKMLDAVSDPQALINNIQVVRSITLMVHETLQPQLLTFLSCIFGCLRHCHVAVRLAASRCIASMAKSTTSRVMAVVIEKILPMLQDMKSVHARRGAGMLINLLVQGLSVELIPYATVLVVPLLGCMSDSDHAVRQNVTHSFAALVPLLPLARGVPAPQWLSENSLRKAEDAHFLEQLLDNSHIDDFKLPIELKVTLRRYQQEGINWLSFLRRFKLHGILCDDMGLGKTLQASAIVASDIVERRVSSNQDGMSIIICPSTLVGHWAYEIEKYIEGSVMVPMQYIGSAQERAMLREQFHNFNVMITSYDIVRKDIDYLGMFTWNYCILDEGHVIKNARSKITCAVKQVKAEYRLILSGTPIQNNVLELWSLFDFLMPGFLGSERQFQAAYGKPLLAAKEPKCSAREAEASILAMEALHRQVMPFLLRRTKDDVLSDLPRKIIQDRFCDLSPVQLRLYEKFSGSGVKREISTLVKAAESDHIDVETSSSPKTSSHIFQALQYLLKLCSHPLLALGGNPPNAILDTLAELFSGSSNVVADLHDLHHAPKLVALQEILEECGIGVETSGSDGLVGVGQHRVLVFAQHKMLLDMIERDLFQAHMKSVTYLRLDGSVDPEKRFEIVKAFNSDPTIDVLLLTTHVGGLGLNLTSADTLVFMEHDWNPMRDHQAMDRAHRLGQKKTVNVHRLIMRGTLEEKVMNLQKFKISVANAVINAENASLSTMNTGQLLDLFTPAQTSGRIPGHPKQDCSVMDDVPKSRGKGLKAILCGLEELWDQTQYTEEYNLSVFLAKLNG